jgi:hypothetical protein
MERIPRRKNDAMAEKKSDSPFAKEVKRFARARNLNARSLAAKMDFKDQGTITRDLLASGSRMDRAGRRGTRPSTARKYADALGVSRAYLCALATQRRQKSGNFSPPELSEDDYGPAGKMLHAILNYVEIHFAEGKTRESLWDTIVAFMEGEASKGLPVAYPVLRKLYLENLRRESEKNVGILDDWLRSEEFFCATALRSGLAEMGIDLWEWLEPVDEDDLIDHYLAGKTTKRGQRDSRWVDLRVEEHREFLRAYGLYRETLDINLEHFVTTRQGAAFRRRFR